MNTIRTFASAAVLLLLASQASAQTTACVPPTAPSAVSFGRTQITFTSPDHTAVEADGTQRVTDYFGEVRVKGQTALVTNFTIPKASVAPIASSVTGCLGSLLPAMAPLLPTDTYTLTWFARGPGGSTVSATTADFFLRGAPAAPANTALVTPGT